MRNYEASADWAQEIKRWIGKTLTFATASALAFARARGPTPGTATAVGPRRRAEAPFTSTRRSGNGGASNGPTCSPTTPTTSIASRPRSGFIARRIRDRRGPRSPISISRHTNGDGQSRMARLPAAAMRLLLWCVGCARRAPRANLKPDPNAHSPTGRIFSCPVSCRARLCTPSPPRRPSASARRSAAPTLNASRPFRAFGHKPAQSISRCSLALRCSLEL